MDRVIAPIAIVVAVGIAVAFYVFAFSLIPSGAASNPPQELDAAQILWSTGSAYLIIFVVLNFWLEGIWFPRPHRAVPGNMMPVPPLVGETKRAHISMGSVEAAVFIIGVVLIGTGCSLMGTRGYGSF